MRAAASEAHTPPAPAPATMTSNAASSARRSSIASLLTTPGLPFASRRLSSRSSAGIVLPMIQQLVSRAADSETPAFARDLRQTRSNAPKTP